MNFTNDEMNLMCIYDTGNRTGLINALSEMRKELSMDETDLRELTDSTLNKLSAMSDEDYAKLELYPDLTSKMSEQNFFSIYKKLKPITGIIS